MYKARFYRLRKSKW